MAARSRTSIAALALVAAACSPTSPTAAPTGPPGAATNPPATAEPTPSRPPATQAPSPAPTHAVGVFPNPDGSTLVGLPARFDFAQADESGIWGVLQDETGRDVVVIDPATFKFEVFIDDLPIMLNPVHGVPVNGSFWMSSWDRSSVAQYDLETGEHIRDIKVGQHPVEPVPAYGDVWTLDHHGDSVTRIDVETGEARSVKLPGALPLSMTLVADDVMLVNGAGTLTYVVDPVEMKLVGTWTSTQCFDPAGWILHGIEGGLWRKVCDRNEVVILDPRTGKVLDSFEAPINPAYEPLVVDGIWWFPTRVEEGPGRFGLAGLDPETRTILGTWETPTDITAGWALPAFDAWWRWGHEGLVHVPADNLRAAVR